MLTQKPDAIIIDAGSSGSRVYVYKWAKVDKQIRNVLALDDASREGKDILGHNCNLFNIGDAGHDTGCWMKERATILLSLLFFVADTMRH